MADLAYLTPDGTPARLKTLLPQVSNPQALTEAELASYGIARCTVVQPPVEWWQQHGARTVDTSVTPHVISWAVEDRPLDEVKSLAWARIKAEREVRQSGLMPYLFGDVTHHIEFTERAKADLTAQTTAAIGMLVAQIPGTLVWTVFENVTHQLTPTEMLTLGFTAGQWQASIHSQSQTIREAIYAATDVQGVVAAAVWGRDGD